MNKKAELLRTEIEYEKITWDKHNARFFPYMVLLITMLVFPTNSRGIFFAIVFLIATGITILLQFNSGYKLKKMYKRLKEELK
jgi:hypothetical protein